MNMFKRLKDLTHHRFQRMQSRMNTRRMKRGIFETGNSELEQTRATKEDSNSDNYSGHTATESQLKMNDQEAISASKRSSARRSQVLDLDSIMVGIEEYLNNDDSDHEQIMDGHRDSRDPTDVPVNIVDGELCEKGRNVIDLTGEDEDNDKDTDKDKGKGKDDGEKRNDEKSIDDETLPTTQELLIENKDSLNQFSASSNLSGETPVSTQNHVVDSETKSLTSREDEPTKDQESHMPASTQGVQKGSNTPSEKSAHVQNDQRGHDLPSTEVEEPVRERLASDETEPAAVVEPTKIKERAAKSTEPIEDKVELTKDVEGAAKSTEPIEDKVELTKGADGEVKVHEKAPKISKQAEDKLKPVEDAEGENKQQQHVSKDAKPTEDNAKPVEGSEKAPTVSKTTGDKVESTGNTEKENKQHDEAFTIAKTTADEVRLTGSVEKENTQHEQAPTVAKSTEDKVESTGNTEKENKQHDEAPTSGKPVEHKIESIKGTEKENKQHEESPTIGKPTEDKVEPIEGTDSEQTKKASTIAKSTENKVEPIEGTEKENKQHEETPTIGKPAESKAEQGKQLQSTSDISVENPSSRYIEPSKDRDIDSAKKNPEGDLRESHVHPSENSEILHTEKTLENSAEQHAPQSGLEPAEEKEPSSTAGQLDKSIPKGSRTENRKSDEPPSNTLNYQQSLISDANVRGSNSEATADGPKADENTDKYGYKYGDKYEPDVRSDLSGQIPSAIEQTTEGQGHHEGTSIPRNAYASDSACITEGAVVGSDREGNTILPIEGTKGGTGISIKEETGADAGCVPIANDSDGTDDSDLHSKGASQSPLCTNNENADKPAKNHEARTDSETGNTNQGKNESKDRQENYEEPNTIVKSEQEHQEKQPQSPREINLDAADTSDTTQATLPSQKERQQQEQPVSRSGVADTFPTAETNNLPPQNPPQTDSFDAETEAILRGLDNPEELLRDLESERRKEPVYIFTSLAGGGFHIIPRTNRLATILQANRIEFSYRDLGTDPQARNLWKAHASGKQLPGLVRGSDVVGNWQDVEDANEEYRLEQLLYSV
ncbi:hypothetical protein ZYGR_0AM00240 [Zygosaccharomyces rouxii]|uniref:Uncharacterized protein n=1 Tax=Zygosaccharomyces rouxii TaxID=4956 RepID=A0A1Q3AFE4_ZYGRO|nr:hypothetical protein ZYGR_0AM00240 [Zygosaccharomyces rouxii]